MWITGIYQPTHLILHKAFTPGKGVPFGKIPGLHLNAPRDDLVLILVHLGSIFQCLNTLTVYSVWAFSHLIFSDFELHPLILWQIIPRQKKPSCSHWLPLGMHLDALIKGFLRFPFDKRNRPNSWQGFYSVRFIPSIVLGTTFLEHLLFFRIPFKALKTVFLD